MEIYLFIIKNSDKIHALFDIKKRYPADIG